MISANDALLALLDTVAEYRSASEFARAVGVSKAHISRVLSGQRAIDGKLAKRLGLKRIDAYVPIKKGGKP